MDKAKIKQAYKERKPAMGVYKIEIANSELCFIGSAMDLLARFNRHKTELKFGSHRNRDLQQLWKVHGERAFDFVILDELEWDKESNQQEDLEVLLDMWVQKMKDNSNTIMVIK